MAALIHGNDWSWKSEQQARLLKEGRRAWNVTRLVEGVHLKKMLQQCTGLLRDARRWQPLRTHSQAHSAMLLRCTARSAALVYQNGVVATRLWPWPLFKIVEDRSVAATLQQTVTNSPCMLDLFTQRFVRCDSRAAGLHHAQHRILAQPESQVGEGKSTDTCCGYLLACSASSVLVWASLAETCGRGPKGCSSSAGCYSPSSSSQLGASTHSTQTTAASWLPSSSEEEGEPNLPQAQPPAEATSSKQQVAVAVAGPPPRTVRGRRKLEQTGRHLSRPGAGGAWRAFCSWHGRGCHSILRAERVKELAAEYNSLTPTRRSFFEKMGRHAAALRARGETDVFASTRVKQRPPKRDPGPVAKMVHEQLRSIGLHELKPLGRATSATADTSPSSTWSDMCKGMQIMRKELRQRARGQHFQVTGSHDSCDGDMTGAATSASASAAQAAAAAAAPSPLRTTQSTSSTASSLKALASFSQTKLADVLPYVPMADRAATVTPFPHTCLAAAICQQHLITFSMVSWASSSA